MADIPEHVVERALDRMRRSIQALQGVPHGECPTDGLREAILCIESGTPDAGTVALHATAFVEDFVRRRCRDESLDIEFRVVIAQARIAARDFRNFEVGYYTEREEW